ncbi:MAG: hypothetical protein HC874_14175 [Richelia sp. SL_2_1]|nr:hypothetical protein [Richelia sp. SL_2_1]
MRKRKIKTPFGVGKIVKVIYIVKLDTPIHIGNLEDNSAQVIDEIELTRGMVHSIAEQPDNKEFYATQIEGKF